MSESKESLGDPGEGFFKMTASMYKGLFPDIVLKRDSYEKWNQFIRGRRMTSHQAYMSEGPRAAESDL